MRLPFIPWSIAGVPSSQALPGFLLTAPPFMCVPAVIGALAVWIHKKNKKWLPDVHHPPRLVIEGYSLPKKERKNGVWE